MSAVLVQAPRPRVPGPRGAPARTGSPAGPRTGAATVDCLISFRTNTPRDGMGNLLSPGGRWLILDAVASLYGITGSAGSLTRDSDRRWSWPAHGLHASVAHCGPLAAVALSTGPRVGVDLQDERDRPGAMAWLGALLGNPEGCPATIRDFAESEALIKVSSITKETFAGVRLPPWTPGWRPVPRLPYRLLSTTTAGGAHLAVAVEAPGAASGAASRAASGAGTSDVVEVRWWQSRDGERPRRVPDPHRLGAIREEP